MALYSRRSWLLTVVVIVIVCEILYFGHFFTALFVSDAGHSTRNVPRNDDVRVRENVTLFRHSAKNLPRNDDVRVRENATLSRHSTKNVARGNSVRVRENVTLSRHSTKNVAKGDNVRVRENVTLSRHPVKNVAKGDNVQVGENATLSRHSVKNVAMGDNVQENATLSRHSVKNVARGDNVQENATLSRHSAKSVSSGDNVRVRENFTVSLHSQEDVPRFTGRGFLLPVTVDQQLTGGLKGFTQLATLAAIFNLSTVEPYVQDSKLVGVPKDQDPGILRLSDIYDWEDLSRNFKGCSKRTDHQISSFETFLKYGFRDIILVQMVTTVTDFKSFFSGTSKRIIEVNHHNQNFLSSVKLLNKWVESLQSQPSRIFRPARIVLVDARPSHSLPLSVLVKGLGSIITEEVSKFQYATVLFVRWRAITPSAPRAQFYFIPEFFWRPCQSIDLIKHSKSIVNTSAIFSQSLNDSHSDVIVGVHIRGERLLMEYKGNVSHCLDRLESLLHNLSLNGSERVAVRIVHDLGDFGTKSCDHGLCLKRAKNFVPQIQKLGYPIVSFDPARFSSVPTSSGFAAHVETEYLSNVDILVTLGWGGFQHVVSQRFLHKKKHKRKNDNWHQICSSPSSP